MPFCSAISVQNSTEKLIVSEPLTPASNMIVRPTPDVLDRRLADDSMRLRSAAPM